MIRNIKGVKKGTINLIINYKLLYYISEEGMYLNGTLSSCLVY